MPTKVEAELKANAEKAIPMPENASEEEKKRIQERRDAYVFGTLRSTGWKPRREQ